MPHPSLPPFPFGAVYFRKSNPPKSDWARDYRTASEDGMTAFRHWFLWGAIEVTPGVFDWDDYDRQLDLAAENGIRTVIAEMITCAPEWAYRRLAHARYESRDGRKVTSSISASTVVGGFPGLCLDNDDVREAAGRFLTALATRYRDHPGLGAYDIWNECNIGANVCYCPATAERFRQWLRDRYGDLRSLGDAWHRHSFAEWEDVTPPRDLGPYPHVLDWLQFRIDNAYRLMSWRADLLRKLDPNHPVTAHGVAGGLHRLAPQAADDWRAASIADSYGFTWVACRQGDEPWKHFHAVDLVRSASRGKDFWHSEAQGGPLWMQPQVPGRPREDGRIASPEDLRYWHLVTSMGGARGHLYPRWRPLLDGPLFGAFGPYGMDGSRTDRSAMSSRLAKWVSHSAQQKLWASRPVKGDVGILFVPETQLFTYAQQGKTDFHARSLHGAYRGFWDRNIQADWVHIDHIDEYSLLYWPYPVAVSEEHALRIMEWVGNGGTLMSEGCPAYWDDRGHVGQRQPNLELDELFGAREAYVEFTPDLLDNLKLRLDSHEVWGGLFLQAYEVTTGTPVGTDPAGRVVAVDHAWGRGKTRLIGSMLGWGYGVHGEEPSGSFFEETLAFGGRSQHVRCSDGRVKARLHDGEEGTFLWVANPARRDLPVRLTLSDRWGPFAHAETLWGADASVQDRAVTLTAPARDVSVIALT
ncbi:MAG: beta-galactosidase [Deltaproteobacteria bacterium]|nr:beta-galactosidase [Deltaproteobacteria bacterium]